MSTASLSVRQIMDLGIWDKVCECNGINPYAINEGLMEYDEIIQFDTEFKKDVEKVDREVCYMVTSYDKNGNQEDTDMVYTTVSNHKKDLIDAIESITKYGGIVGMIILETELEWE